MTFEINDIDDVLFAKAVRWANVKLGLGGASCGYTDKKVTDQILKYFDEEAGLNGNRNRIRSLIGSKLQEWEGKGLLGKTGTGEIRLRDTGDEYISNLLNGTIFGINLRELRKIIRDDVLYDYLSRGILEIDYNKRISDAVIYLEKEAKSLATGSCLTLTNFAKNHTGSEPGRLAPQSWDKQRADGLRNLGIGLIWIIRNPTIHSTRTIENPVDFVQEIINLDYYLDIIRNSSLDENVSSK